MLIYIILALSNGVFIGMSRAINGKLSQHIGSFNASLSNHIVGFITLSLLFLPVFIGLYPTELNVNQLSNAPLTAYLGGVIGALYVAINSFVLVRVGATNTALLVISGQMLTGVMIDYQSDNLNSLLFTFVGVTLIVIGMILPSKLKS